MKMKWFLRGLGTGIIVATLLLCISYRQQSDHSELIKEAKKIGMVFPKGETDTVELEKTVEKIQKENAASQAAVSTSNESEQDKKSREKMEKSKEDITSVSTYQKKKRTIVVLPTEVLSSETITKKLEDEGLVADAKEFDKYLEEYGYAKKIRSGKYKIPKGADYEEIAKIITKQN